MKKLLVIIALAGMALASCRKDRVCSCKITTDGTTQTHTQSGGFPPFVPAVDTTTVQPMSSYNTQKATYHKVTKNTMLTNCMSHSEESLNQSSSSSSAGIYTITTIDKGTKTYDCTIE